jgi:hypothetical protein
VVEQPESQTAILINAKIIKIDLTVGSWKLEVGSWKLEVGSWKCHKLVFLGLYGEWVVIKCYPLDRKTFEI